MSYLGTKPANSPLTSELIPDGIIGTSDIANSAVTVSKISASGTADSTTYLRGDGSWQTISTTPTTAQVLSATAGASLGAIGTYAFCINTDTATQTAGGTVSGSTLGYGTAGSSVSGGTPSGTWRRMGGNGNATVNPTVYLRIA